MNVEESALDRYGCELNNFSHLREGTNVFPEAFWDYW